MRPSTWPSADSHIKLLDQRRQNLPKASRKGHACEGGQSVVKINASRAVSHPATLDQDELDVARLLQLEGCSSAPHAVRSKMKGLQAQTIGQGRELITKLPGGGPQDTLLPRLACDCQLDQFKFPLRELKLSEERILY